MIDAEAVINSRPFAEEALPAQKERLLKAYDEALVVRHQLMTYTLYENKPTEEQIHRAFLAMEEVATWNKRHKDDGEAIEIK